MQVCDVKEMLQYSYESPRFFVNYHDVGRGLIGGDGNTKSYIKSTKTLKYWRIIADNVEAIQSKEILFDSETYLFQWTFEYTTEDGRTHEETLYYYWKGLNASKGYSPLPAEIENENTIIERISQWSEPAIFFHIFSKNLIVFSGSHETFNPTTKRLFMVRGELPSEVHLYELPCLRESLRSRGIFLLLNPSECTIYFWHGSGVPNKHQNLQSILQLNERGEHWKNYKIVEVQEENEYVSFFNCIGQQTGNYAELPKLIDFTPRLFYFNSITEDFLATKVEYPLESKEQAAFPFLQSHLYTADQPALFLLDNDSEIWLWEGWKTPEGNMESFEVELRLAKETANNYAKEKGHNVRIPVKHVLAGLEPLEFTNIFPYWTKRDDIARLQLKHIT